MTLDLKDLKKQLRKEGFYYVEQIKSGGFATTLLVKEGILAAKQRCGKIFIDGDTDANRNEFKIMETLYSIAPDKFPQPFKFLELKIKSNTYNDVFHKVNVIIMELLDPLVIPSDADADFWKKFLTDLTENLVLMHSIEHNHKDIKPGNILMKNGRFVFIDFGITVVNDVTLKSTGICCCTAYFASPETLKGKLSKRGDIYSLGATARALVLNRKDEIITHNKFGDMSFDEIIKQKKNLKPMAPKEKSFEFICNVINKAMSFNVDDRYQSAVELLNVLNPVADKHTAIKKKTSPIQQKTFVDFATQNYIDNHIEDSYYRDDIDSYDFDNKKNPDSIYKPYLSKKTVHNYNRDEISVDIDILIDNATEEMQKKQYEKAIEILKYRNEESARILRAKAYIYMGNATSKANYELEGIEHPCAYFLKAKILKENGDNNSLFMSYLRKSSSYDYPPALLAYGVYSKNYDYVIKAAQIYSTAFRVVAKLAQKSLVSMDDYASLNNQKRFTNIHQLDKAFLKYYDNNFAPYE